MLMYLEVMVQNFLKHRRITRLILNSRRNISLSRICPWQKFENERHYEPDEDFRRVWHGNYLFLRRLKFYLFLMMPPIFRYYLRL